MNSSLPNHLYQSTNELVLSNLSYDIDKNLEGSWFLTSFFHLQSHKLASWWGQKWLTLDPHKLALATSTEPTLAVCAKMLAAILSPNLSEGSRIRWRSSIQDFLGHSIQTLNFLGPKKNTVITPATCEKIPATSPWRSHHTRGWPNEGDAQLLSGSNPRLVCLQLQLPKRNCQKIKFFWPRIVIPYTGSPRIMQ